MTKLDFTAAKEGAELITQSQDYHLEAIYNLAACYLKLVEENEDYKKALEFYGDGDGDVLDWDRVNNPSCIQDRGKRARETLERVGEKL